MVGKGQKEEKGSISFCQKEKGTWHGLQRTKDRFMVKAASFTFFVASASSASCDISRCGAAPFLLLD